MGTRYVRIPTKLTGRPTILPDRLLMLSRGARPPVDAHTAKAPLYDLPGQRLKTDLLMIGIIRTLPAVAISLPRAAVTLR
jgi:hypothetical protein